jgi:hypothetical protein
MRHTLSNGQRITIVAEELDGIWLPWHNQISVRASLKGRGMIEALVHELLHAELHDVSEERVRRTARSIARLIWNLRKRMENDREKANKLRRGRARRLRTRTVR